MANRNMSSGLIATTSKPLVQYYELVYIGVNNGYYLTNAPFDISYGGNNYKMAGALLSIDNIVEDIGFEIQKLNISISGIAYLDDDTLPFMQEVLGVDYIDKDIIIHRAYYEYDVYQDSLEVYKGFIDSASINDGLGEEGSNVSITTSSHWSNFARITGRHTNNTSQQSYFPSDLGFEYSKDIQKQIEWKKPA
tara:strand:- start:1907 stop:2485 length:579 start_codon:yes stop_codon:yes gene_type:complete